MPVGSGGSATTRLAMATAVTTVLAAIATVAAGWPYWERHPLVALPNVGLAVALVVTGMLLGGPAGTRRCGVLLGLAGVCSAVTWLMSWDVGPLPLTASFAQSVYWLAYAGGLLCYPGNSLRSAADRWWMAFAAVVLLAGQALTVVISRPSWNGFSADVLWPAPFLLDQARFDVVMDVLLVSYVLVPTTFILLAAIRIRAARGLERAVVAPVLLSAGLVALVAAVTYPGLMADPTLGRIEDALALQGAASVLAPGALLVVGARRRLAVASAADRVLGAIRSPTALTVQKALQTVLRDDTLAVHYREPGTGALVDLHGRPVDEPGRPPSAGPGYRGAGGDHSHPTVDHSHPTVDRSYLTVDRWHLPVSSPGGEPIAVVVADPALRRHRPLVDAALDAAAAAIASARLQCALQAQLVRLAGTQRRLAGTEARERARIERELHDGVQQRLIALDMTASAFEGSVTDPVAVRALAEIREGLRAAHGEVRAIARGLHPAVLGQDGLRRALEHVTGTLRLSARLRVAPERFDAATERAMYFALAEALRHVAERAGPGAGAGVTVRVDVRADGPVLIGEVTGARPLVDGMTGGPVPVGEMTSGRPRVGEMTGGPVPVGEMAAGAVTLTSSDQVRALGGSIDLCHGADGAATTRVTIPCG